MHGATADRTTAPTASQTTGSPTLPAPVTSAADRAYAAVRARVVSGEVPGGTMLSEGEVADELGMSRTPVREAFLRLQAEGWMQLFPKRGAMVRPIEPDELAEVVEARHLVESSAVRAVAADDGATTTLVARLRALVESQRAAAERGDLDTFALVDVTFHQTIADAGGNSILTGFYASLRDRQHRITARSVRAGQDRAGAILAQHTDLVDLVEARDPAGFGEALVAHLGEIHRGIFGR